MRLCGNHHHKTTHCAANCPKEYFLKFTKFLRFWGHIITLNAYTSIKNKNKKNSSRTPGSFRLESGYNTRFLPCVEVTYNVHYNECLYMQLLFYIFNTRFFIVFSQYLK